MVKWYHQLNGHEFEQTPGNIEGQGNLACCSPWGRKEMDMTTTTIQGNLTKTKALSQYAVSLLQERNITEVFLCTKSTALGLSTHGLQLIMNQANQFKFSFLQQTHVIFSGSKLIELTDKIYDA